MFLKFQISTLGKLNGHFLNDDVITYNFPRPDLHLKQFFLTFFFERCFKYQIVAKNCHKGSVIFYHQGGSWNLKGIPEIKKGEQKDFWYLKEGGGS